MHLPRMVEDVRDIMPTLSLPDPSGPVRAQALIESEAGNLFVECAEAAVNGFVLTRMRRPLRKSVDISMEFR